MGDLTRLAKLIRTIFEEKYEELDIPFFGGFPENCCEGASLFFGFIAKNIFPEMSVMIIKGSKVFDDGEEGYHFWVEVDGKAFDLTSDQFNFVEGPIINKKIKGKHIGFSIESRQCVLEFLLYYFDNCLEEERFFPIYEKIIFMLKTHKEAL